MSLEAHVAALSANVGNLVNRVTTQADQWDAKVAQAQQQVNQYISNARSLSMNREVKTFKVLGNADIFYPVIFGTEWRFPTELIIFRRNVHADGTHHGSLFFEIHYFPTNGGHGSEYTRLVKHLFSYRMLIARYYVNIYGNLIVWLKGQTTYEYICSQHNVSVDFEASEKAFILNGNIMETYNILTAVDADLQSPYIGYGR